MLPWASCTLWAVKSASSSAVSTDDPNCSERCVAEGEKWEMTPCNWAFFAFVVEVSNRFSVISPFSWIVRLGSSILKSPAIVPS